MILSFLFISLTLLIIYFIYYCNLCILIYIDLMGKNILQNIQVAHCTPTFQVWKVSCLFLFVYYLFFFIYLSIYLSIIVIVSLLLLFTIIFTFNVYMYIYIYIFLHILFKYASKVRATYIIIPENDGSKAPIQLLGRGRSCLGFVRSGIFGLGIAPKKKLSCLLNLVSVQK